MAVLPPRSRPATFCLAVYMLFNARWKDDEGMGDEGKMLKRGQLYVGRKVTSLKTGLTPQNYRTAMANLTKVRFCVTEPTNEGTTVTIVDYDTYCPLTFGTNTRTNQKVTNDQPTGNQRVTSEPTTVEEVDLEESKEWEKGKEDITPQERGEASGVLRLLEEKVYNQDPEWLGSDRRLIQRMALTMRMMETQMIVDLAVETQASVIRANIPGPYLMSILENHDEDSIAPILPEVEVGIKAAPKRRAYDEAGNWLIDRREMTLDEVRESRELREKRKEAYG